MSDEALIRFTERGVITVGKIHVGSVLDAVNVSQFGKEALHYVSAHPGMNLLLDFETVEYLSSAVLTELLRINQACKDVDGGLRLCGLNDDISKVFEITNLDKMFVIYGPVDEAVMRFARSLAIQAEEDAWSHVRKDP